MDQVHEGALSALEAARRGAHYRLMQGIAAALLDVTHGNENAGARHVRARVYYERHMAAYEQALTCSGWRRKRFLERSLELANLSRAEARTDVLDVLHAEMNISGLLLPALERAQEGFLLSESVSERAEDFAAAHGTSEEDVLRAQRVALNCYFHRGRIIVTGGGSKAKLDLLMHKIRANRVYIEKFRFIDSIKDDIPSFETYLRS